MNTCTVQECTSIQKQLIVNTVSSLSLDCIPPRFSKIKSHLIQLFDPKTDLGLSSVNFCIILVILEPILTIYMIFYSSHETDPPVTTYRELRTTVILKYYIWPYRYRMISYSMIWNVQNQYHLFANGEIEMFKIIITLSQILKSASEMEWRFETHTFSACMGGSIHQIEKFLKLWWQFLKPSSDPRSIILKDFASICFFIFP